MNVQMTDLKAQYESIKDEIVLAVAEVIAQSNFILGKQVSLFEQEVAKYLDIKYAVTVASGTDALVLALAALGIGAGDEVITTPFTFIATAEAISRCGAIPVFCDIEPETFNLDPSKIEKKITSKTKAILPVHLYGLACNMKEMVRIAKANNLRVIEDCAQSFGSEYGNKRLGGFGDCSCFSFFPAKTLGCYGDGGMVATNDEDVAQRLLSLRNHGQDSKNKYIYHMHGFNSRFDTLQAAVLRVKLKYIDKWITKRIENARIYNDLLSGSKFLITPKVPQDLSHTFNYYTVRIGKNRDSVKDKLKEKGIPSAVYYPLCLHLQEVYKDLGYKQGDFPIAEQSQAEVLSLPMYAELTKEMIQNICKELGDVPL